MLCLILWSCECIECGLVLAKYKEKDDRILKAKIYKIT